MTLNGVRSLTVYTFELSDVVPCEVTSVYVLCSPLLSAFCLQCVCAASHRSKHWFLTGIDVKEWVNNSLSVFCTEVSWRAPCQWTSCVTYKRCVKLLDLLLFLLTLTLWHFIWRRENFKQLTQNISLLKTLHVLFLSHWCLSELGFNSAWLLHL